MLEGSVEAPIELSGWLIKRSSGLRSWKRRWAQIEADGHLRFYANKQGAVRRTVALEHVLSVSEAPCDTRSRKYGFVVELEVPKGGASRNKQLALCADDEGELQRWLAAFVRVVERNRWFLENVRRAVLCFLAIRKFRRDECEHVGAASKDVVGITVGLVWKSRFEERRLWLF
jgi:hypothetical protein